MPVSGVRAAVRSALSGFATTIAYENETDAPPETEDAWVFVEITGGDYTQESIGVEPRASNRWDERGVIFAHVFVPWGSGMDGTDTILAALAGVFKGQELAGGYEMQDMTTGPGERTGESGLWFRTTLTIDWIKR